jgi:hypothetical protein
MADGNVTVRFLNAQGNGFAKPVEVKRGTTAVQFIAEQLGNEAFEKYTIRVGGRPAIEDEVLEDNVAVLVVPQKQEGARR